MYTFDTLARLRDTQLAAIRNPAKTASVEEENLSQYVKYGALGEAIKATQERNLRAVLLLDEIDKGNNDFCNDLLDVLEQFSFKVPEVPNPKSKSDHELKDKVLEFRSPPNTKPIVILTSNRDKPLPDAFLRRCLYYSIPFPEATELKELAKWRLQKDNAFAEVQEIFDDAVKLFYEVRQAMNGRMNREPSTSEFIDFLQALRKNPKERESVLTKLESHTYYLGILLKNQEDQDRYREYKKKPPQS